MAPLQPLAPELLFTPCPPEIVPFATTAEVEELTEIIGQARAQEAVHFGIGIRREGYNLYVMGPSGMGKHTMVEEFLSRKAAERPTPPDWCYVNNFAQPHKPRALRLPAGRGSTFAREMTHLVEELANAIPAAFESDEYRSGLQAIEEEFKGRQERAFAELAEEAEQQQIKLFRTPAGFAFAPMRGDEVIAPDEFEKLPREEQQRIESLVSKLQERLQEVLQRIPEWRKETRERVKGLNQAVTLAAVGHFIDDMKKGYADLPELLTYLDEVARDVAENVDDFRKGEEGEPKAKPTEIHRYKVNLLVDNSETRGAPVVYLDHPTFQDLVGRAEHLAQFGALVTDFTLLKPGALHRANGGYLMLDTHKLLGHPFAWEGLKRSLYSGRITIESLEKMLSLVSTVSLEPEPIPLDVKVVLMGDRILYYLLFEYDPDFAELFKVAADFEERIARTPENVTLFARLIATLARKEGLRPFDRTAVARVVEYGSRLEEDAEKLSTHMRSIADLLREADYWADHGGNGAVTAADVQRAIDQQMRRASRLKEQIHEEILRHTILIETQGAKVGQVNGLSVLGLGNTLFGQPSRITATAHVGSGHVVDIEREVELGGPIHSKGVMILSSFIASRYARNHPLSLSASLVFEQSYGGVDGDSASMAELCALLSVLADLPIRQSLAMTGSVDQHGQAQPIGGVNEKIEGFFDVCAARGLDQQGVIIPASNIKHLMLRRDVVEAAREERFHIYAMANIDEAIELLTGVPAGSADATGTFPPDSVNGRVQARLFEMAETLARFGDGKERLGDEGGIEL